ncbi:Acidic leucine-rich nuclear phosphoprotein 32 family member A [Aphelenchoides besseyi]|nr:Acidic leucine-rich nuclear phosphoprotein 32 family member A [Aphelenchoides besseyi]
MANDSAAESNPMKAYIDGELKARKPEEITELLLDNCKSPNIVGFEGHKFDRLNHISFIGCDLESLDGLPVLSEVRVLDLSENKLKDVSKLSVDQLKPLGKLENLQALDVFDCPVTEKEDYREKVFQAIPTLKFLDGFDVNNEEADDLGMDGEDADAEGMEDMGSDIEEDEEGVGLDYLDSSKVMKDDDSADYVDNGKTNGKSAAKRKREDHGDSEVPEKKMNKEEA